MNNRERERIERRIRELKSQEQMYLFMLIAFCLPVFLLGIGLMLMAVFV